MKILERSLLIALMVIVLFLIVAFFVLNHVKKAAIPDYSKDIALKGLSSEVTVLRDSHGIPHVYAKTGTDLYRAFGFVLALDRLWQMDLLRRGLRDGFLKSWEKIWSTPTG